MGYNALSGLNYLEPIDTQGVALGCVRLAFQAGKSFAGWRLSAYAGNILALHTRERPANKHHMLWPLALSGYPPWRKESDQRKIKGFAARSKSRFWPEKGMEAPFSR